MNDDVGKCEKAAGQGGTPRFRMESGAWHAFAPDRWRCVRTPDSATVRVNIDGAVTIGFKPGACASRTFDLIGPNFYGSYWAQCSTRKVEGDERLQE